MPIASSANTPRPDFGAKPPRRGSGMPTAALKNSSVKIIREHPGEFRPFTQLQPCHKKKQCTDGLRSVLLPAARGKTQQQKKESEIFEPSEMRTAGGFSARGHQKKKAETSIPAAEVRVAPARPETSFPAGEKGDRGADDGYKPNLPGTRAGDAQHLHCRSVGTSEMRWYQKPMDHPSV